MKPILRRTLHGALSGAIGAACMTVARMLAHRAKVIDQMIPQAVEAWAKHRLAFVGEALPSERALHHIADQALHIGYGAGLGALYGLGLGSRRATPTRVLAFGTGAWVFGSFFLLPALKIVRAEWRAKPVEIVVNLGAHLLYAGAVALLTEEFESQSFVQPLQYPLSLIAKTG